MIQRHVLFVVFLALVSANVEGFFLPHGLFSEGLFGQGFLPNFNFLDIPKIGEFSNNLATSAASAASTAFDGFKSYLDNFRSGLDGLNMLPKFNLLHRLFNRPDLIKPEILSKSANTIADTITSKIVPSADRLIRPGLLGNLLGNGIEKLGDNSDTASAASAASAAA